MRGLGMSKPTVDGVRSQLAGFSSDERAAMALAATVRCSPQLPDLITAALSELWLPVMAADEIVGILSSMDVVRAVGLTE